MENSTFVLVHGAWSGAWCWRDVAASFDARGIAWRSVDLPSSRFNAPGSTNLIDDALHLIDVVGDLGRVTLVGHSYGGAVISEAASNIGGLERMVYIAALVPLRGESASDASRAVRVRTELDDAIEVDGDYLRLNRERAVPALYGQCDSHTQLWATSNLSTQTLASFRTKRTSARSEVASLYVKCRDDRAVDPGLQNLMAARCDEHVEIDSDHSPFLSHPLELLEAILD